MVKDKRNVFNRSLMSISTQRQWWPMLIVAGVGIAVLLPAMILGVPHGPDLPAHLRNALSFSESIHQGDLYQSWMAQANNGYGDPSLRLYPPFLYYLLTASHALIKDWYAAVLLAFTFLSVAGGLGVYFLARAFCSPRAAMWAGVFYVLAPFHINELYQSSLLAEYAGGVALAFAFGFLERACRHGRWRDMAGLAVSYAALILTHIPLGMMGSLAFLLYALLRIDRRDFWRTSARLALAAVLGLASSAFYWTTLIAEHTWIKGDQVDPGTRYNYALHFLFKNFSAEDTRIWWVNIVALAMIIMLWPALAPSSPQPEEAGRRGIKALKLLTAFSFLMATPASWPLWMIIPKLGSIEFPWRWLALTSMAGSVAVAAAIPFWREKARGTGRPFALLALGSVVIAVAFTIAHPIRGANYLSRSSFDMMLRQLPGSAGLPDGLPVWAAEQTRDMKGEVEAGQRAVGVVSWESERREFRVGPGEAVAARIRTFYYPHWVATASGRNLQTHWDSDGALVVALPAEAATVRLEFREPLRVQASAAVSAIGWLLIGALFAFSWRAVAAHPPARLAPPARSTEPSENLLIKV